MIRKALGTAIRVQLVIVGATIGAVEAIYDTMNPSTQTWDRWSDARINAEVDKAIACFQKEFSQ